MAQEFNNIELKDENVNTNKTSRRSFIKKWGILSLAGLFGLSKMGNMPVVKAAVNDNAEAKDISNDVIRCNTNDVFTSGETAADLADAVNGLNQSFSNALTDLKNTDVAKAVGANGSKFPTVIGVLGAIKTYLSGAVSKSVQVGSSYKIPAGYHDGSSEITAVAKSGTNPTKITTNGTHSTGGYESVNVQVSNAFNSVGIFATVAGRDGQIYRYDIERKYVYIISCIRNDAMQGELVIVVNNTVIFRSHGAGFSSNKLYISGDKLFIVNDATNAGFMITRLG